jgi:diadenylate cyclase
MEHEGWLSALWSSMRSIGVADLLDIAVVSVFIYSILLWFEWTKAAFVARGILILGALYILARQMGMVLTTWIFHGFFAVFVIALVIIFQEEIRRFFERLALWNFRGGRRKPLRTETAEVLLQSISLYAQERIGALIVLRGSDPLERHVEGGVDLDGKLSSALLQSIFDKHSDGHDGAVLIEDDRVRRFGTHLPLSKNLERLVGMGTRHAAALGISELTDALCIVVSEQRGSISVAQNGEIRRMEELHQLEQALTRFIAQHKQQDGRTAGLMETACATTSMKRRSPSVCRSFYGWSLCRALSRRRARTLFPFRFRTCQMD